MARKHLFPLVVILAAAVVAGLLAITNTRALDRPAAAATSSDPAIAFRLEQLDGFERSLRQQLANARPTPSPTTVYRAASVSSSASPSYDDDHGDLSENGDDERDD